MTYAIQNARVGKEPFIAVGLVCDKCSEVSGVAPCTAAETGDAKCYNTRATCTDPDNYAKTTQEIIFCEPRSNLPVGVAMFPALVSPPTKSTTTITSGKGLGDREVVKVKIKDFPHHDRGIDPYISTRTYDAETQGTFWGKWLRRNQYFEGRTLKVYEGFIGEVFSWADFEIYEYDIVDIDGVTNGEVRITAKDLLIRTYGTANKYPVASEGTLLADITAAAGTATLTPTGVGNSDYTASGYIAIGGEVKAFTRSADVLTFTAHGAWGTTDEAHEAGDTVQQCIAWEEVNVVDVLDELLTTGAGIPAANIPYDNGAPFTDIWDVEKDLWLSSSNVYGILTEPEDVNKVVKELSEQFMFDIWYNAEYQEVRIKAIAPERSGVTINAINDQYQILKGSLKVVRESSKRFSEIQVWYDKINYEEGDDIKNFKTILVHADVSRSGVDKYGSNSIKVVKCRWLKTAAGAQKLAGRLLARFADTPELVTFEVAGKDESLLSMAERVAITAWQFQDFNGANEARNFQITSINEFADLDVIKVKALTSSFVGAYGFIAPNTTPDYLSASDTEKDNYAFICYDTGVFTDGEPADKII